MEPELLCDQLIELLSQKPDNGCPTPGGVGSTYYVGNTFNIASFTRDPVTKELRTLVMKTGKRVWPFTGRVLQNNAGAQAVVSDSGVTFNQLITLVTDYKTQLEVEALENFCKAQNMFVIYYVAKGQWKVAGLNKTLDALSVYPGLKLVSGDFPEGVKTTDSNAGTIQVGGAMENLPIHFLVAAGTNAATETYIKAMMTPAA